MNWTYHILPVQDVRIIYNVATLKAIGFLAQRFESVCLAWTICEMWDDQSIHI